MTEAHKKEDATIDLPPSQDGTGQKNKHPAHEHHDASTAEFPASGNSSVDSAAEAASNTIDVAPARVDEQFQTIDEPRSGADVAGTLDRAATSDNNADFSLGEGTRPGNALPLHKVAGYQILQVLGRGAMGVVYKARQTSLNRLVALKMIIAGEHAGEQELSRFHTEAETAAQLQHPHIVQVYDVGLHDGLPYLALEFIDGTSLQAHVANTPQPILPSAQMVEVLAETMDFAHKKGIIHRDLKPANVMLTRPRVAGSLDTAIHSSISLVEETYGTPKIADFGLAKQRYEEDTGQTRSGTILGTPNYMAPEQAEGKIHEVGPLADQYALGAMLYELLTGRPPFRGTTVLETLEQVRSQEPVPPSRLQPKVPRDLETICLKSLSKEKRKRYADCAAFAEDLHRFVAGEPILARPVGLPQRLWRWSRRNPRVAALIGLTAVFAVMAFATFVGSYFQIRREKAETEKYANAAEQAAELALGSLGDLVGKVQDRLKDPALRDVRQDILQLAQQRVKGVLESGTHLPGLERVAGLSHMQMAWIAEDLDQNDEAYKEWLEAYQILKKAAEDHPESTKAACNLGVALHHIGAAALTRGDAQQGREYLNEALAVLKDLDEHPRNGDLSSNVVKQNLAETYDMIGAIDPTPSAALQNYRLAIKLLGAIPETSSTKDNNDKTAALAKSNLLLAMGQMSLGQLDEAESNFVNASKLENHLLVTDPNNLERRLQMARIEENFGQLCLLSSQTKAMKDHFAKALSLYQHLLAADPKNTRHQNAVANAHYGLGAAELRLGEQHEAESNFAEALKIMEGRVKSDSKNNNLKKILMIYRARCGNIKDATATAEKVCKFMGNDKDSLYQAANSYALCAAAVGKGKTISKLTQAEHEERQRYTTSAIEALQKCIALGYDDFLGMKADPDFDPIRDDARFQKLLDELGKRTKKQ